MPQQLLPDTFINNTTHLYLPEVKARSLVLYGLVLGAVVVAAVSAFFVYIDVSFGASGMLRVGAQENQAVRVGDTLLVIAPDVLAEKLRLNRFQQAERGQFEAQTSKCGGAMYAAQILTI